MVYTAVEFLGSFSRLFFSNLFKVSVFWLHVVYVNTDVMKRNINKFSRRTAKATKEIETKKYEETNTKSVNE